MGPVPVMGCSGRGWEQGDQASLRVRVLSPAFHMSFPAPSVLLPWGGRKGTAFLAWRPLATAMGAAGGEQMCWTYIERCARLLAAADPDAAGMSTPGGCPTPGDPEAPSGP